MAGLLAGGVLVDHFDPRLLVAVAGIGGLPAVAACVPPVRAVTAHPGVPPSVPPVRAVTAHPGVPPSVPPVRAVTAHLAVPPSVPPVRAVTADPAAGGEKGQAPPTGRTVRVGDSVGS
jgi:hypothetical protein